MKIGTYYKLPDGRKGLYVGEDPCGFMFVVIAKYTGRLLINCNDPVEEYRESRVFEDEVLIYANGMREVVHTLKSKGVPTNTTWKILARRKITVEEGEGL